MESEGLVTGEEAGSVDLVEERVLMMSIICEINNL